jgi:hypothetical protein
MIYTQKNWIPALRAIIAENRIFIMASAGMYRNYGWSSCTLPFPSGWSLDEGSGRPLFPSREGGNPANEKFPKGKMLLSTGCFLIWPIFRLVFPHWIPALRAIIAEN